MPRWRRAPAHRTGLLRIQDVEVEHAAQMLASDTQLTGLLREPVANLDDPLIRLSNRDLAVVSKGFKKVCAHFKLLNTPSFRHQFGMKPVPCQL